MRRIQWFLLLALTALVVYRGIIPAFTKVDSDFPNYYTSSRLLIKSQSLSRVYDDDWFQQQISALGIDQQGKFSPFPPITSVLMVPLAGFSALAALRIWTALNIMFAAASVVMIRKIVGRSLLSCALLTLLSGIALINNFRLGQAYILIHFLATAGYYLWSENRPLASGMLFGIGAALKYFPLVYLPPLFQKSSRASGIMTVGAFLVLSIVGFAFVGAEASRQFLGVVLGNHAAGLLQNPYASNFQSWNSLLRTLFVRDERFNPNPFIHSELAYTVGICAVLIVSAWLLLYAWKELEPIEARRRNEMRFALLGVWGLLVSPATATYHFLLLILPVALLLREHSSSWKIQEYVIASVYVLIGFIPYSFFHRFDLHGLLSVLSYPRLFLTSCLFISVVSMASRPSVSPIDSRITAVAR